MLPQYLYYASHLKTSFYTGLEPAVFAALVPNSADKPLQELIEEIMGDHEMLVKIFLAIYVSFYVIILSPYPCYTFIFMQTAKEPSSS